MFKVQSGVNGCPKKRKNAETSAIAVEAYQDIERGSPGKKDSIKRAWKSGT